MQISAISFGQQAFGGGLKKVNNDKNIEKDELPKELFDKGHGNNEPVLVGWSSCGGSYVYPVFEEPKTHGKGGKGTLKKSVNIDNINKKPVSENERHNKEKFGTAETR